MYQGGRPAVVLNEFSRMLSKTDRELVKCGGRQPASGRDGMGCDVDAQEVIGFIERAKQTTPVQVYVWERDGAEVDYCSAKVFGLGDKIVFGDWSELGPCSRSTPTLPRTCRPRSSWPDASARGGAVRCAGCYRVRS